MTSKTAIFSLALLTGYASATLASDGGIPDKLRPAANESLALILPAGGVQIYECRASKGSAGYEWAFVAPEADLYDAHGTKVGSHYAGPHWEFPDGSRVVGTTKERADSPEANAIPWLLLSAKSDGREGTLSKVTSVLRVHTVGGVAPTDGCSQATAGKQARVSYTADYFFFTPQGIGSLDPREMD